MALHSGSRFGYTGGFGIRFLVVGVVMLLPVFGAACGSTGDDQGSSSQGSGDAEETTAPVATEAEGAQQSQSNAPSLQDLSIGDTATFPSGATVTVYSFTSPARPNEQIFQPDPGAQFVAADVEVCAGIVERINAAGDPQRTQIGPVDFGVQMPDNTRFPSTISPTKPALPGTILSAGDCVRGSVAFEIPQGQIPSYVLFTASASRVTAKWAVV